MSTTSQALVETVALEPGVTAYQITSLHGPGAVQDAITEIMNRVEREGGAAEFRNPRREYSMQDGLKAWRSRGYVRSLEHA